MKQEEQILVDQEIEEMLEKQATKLVQSSKHQFLSTIFLPPKSIFTLHQKTSRISPSGQFEIGTSHTNISISFERNSPENRLCLQDRFKGCLFCNSPSFKLPEIYRV